MGTMGNIGNRKARGRGRFGSLPFLLAGLLGLVALTNPLQGNPGFSTTGGSTNNVTFSGQAYAVKATVPAAGISTVISDTGSLPGSGGQLEASLLDVSVPGLLTAEVAHATTIGQGDRSRSEASLANLNLAVGGNTITADFLMSRAMAVCGAAPTGSSEIANLVVNGQTITVGTQPNQTVTLPNGTIVINEQTSSSSQKNKNGSSDITVNALHVTINDLSGGVLADVIIASAHADINCTGKPACTGGDFVTGGGWITPSGPHANFAVAGGIKNNAFWGHLQYQDHGTGLKVHGTGVTAYAVVDTTTRHIEGTAEVNGQSGFTYQVDVADNGEPGRQQDTFAIRLSNGYSATGLLAGGNIQLHQPCK
jgi:hypothetical protein